MAATSRLASALAEGLTLPEGPVCVVRPPLDYDLSPLAGPVTVATGVRPDHDGWAARGVTVAVEPVTAPTTIVVLPRSKALARDLIARAAATSELVIVDGQKTDGADALWKECRRRLGDIPAVTKAHGRLFWFGGTEAFADWRATPRVVDGFTIAPGVFSDDGPDRGSVLLAGALPALTGRVADLGAGWGYLSRGILASEAVTELHLVEAEAAAFECARLNVTDPRARFHWADATRWQAEDRLDAVVMNPPFHTGRAGDPSLGRSFIEAAARLLSPSGQLWMVANRHLPYESTLRERFRTVTEAAGTGGFKIFHAARPIR